MPAPDLRRLRVPYLAFFGSADWIVRAENNAPRLQELLDEAGNDDVTVVVIPAADHGLTIPASGPPWQGPEGEGFERLSPTYVETLVRWLTERFASAR